MRGLLEFPIDFKRATAKREGNPLDEAHMLAQYRFGDLQNQIDHGTSNLQNIFKVQKIQNLQKLIGNVLIFHSISPVLIIRRSRDEDSSETIIY